MGTLRPGFTLAEAMMALVILGIAAAGVLLPFSSGAAVQAEGMHRALAARLAGDLMERIVSTPRDEIVKWDGYAEEQGQITDADGGILADSLYARFSREVDYVDVYTPQQGGKPLASNFVRVSVRVCYDGRQVAVLTRLISQ